MLIQFSKYQGTGNDFILIDNRQKKINKDKITEIVQKLCNRRFGIGADGLMLLENHEKYDFEMDYYNSDGSGGTMCGNGGRCIVAFAKKNKIIVNNTKFIASDGLHEALIDNQNWVQLKMTDVGEIEESSNHFFLNTGSPHYVDFSKNIEKLNVYEEGRKIRYNERFTTDGTNVNFATWDGKILHVKTYERGVENETLSCGTGVVASAISSVIHYKTENNKPIKIKTKGGNLQVRFKKTNNSFSDIWLEGSATFVFTGQIEF